MEIRRKQNGKRSVEILRKSELPDPICSEKAIGEFQAVLCIEGGTEEVGEGGKRER